MGDCEFSADFGQWQHSPPSEDEKPEETAEAPPNNGLGAAICQLQVDRPSTISVNSLPSRELPAGVPVASSSTCISSDASEESNELNAAGHANTTLQPPCGASCIIGV